jgi:Tfp pilus assembly protein FimT
MSMSKGHSFRQAGFTLIELLVVCAIVIVISAVILVDNNKFGGEVILENLAYDIALTVRQTQVYGIAVERFGTVNCSQQGTNCFSSGYGMYFSLSDPTQYILFADLENTGIYDPNFTNPSYPTGEVVQTTDIQSGYSVQSLCVTPSSGGSRACSPVNEIDILFQRPEPNAFISAAGSGRPVSCSQNPIACNYEAQITLLSPRGATSTVVVDATGQISVQ